MADETWGTGDMPSAQDLSTDSGSGEGHVGPLREAGLVRSPSPACLEGT